MEINKLHGNAISAYKKVTLGTSAAAKENTVKTANTDKIEFDFAGSIGAAKINIASGIEAEANTAKIEELQKLYSGDSCPVSDEEIAGAITGD